MPSCLSLSCRLPVGLCYGLLAATSCCVPDQAATQVPTIAGPVTYNTTTRQLKSNHLPDSVFQLTTLRYLTVQGADCDYVRHDASGKQLINCWMLAELPGSIQNLRNLEELRLPLNLLASLPAEPAALHKLKVLDLSDNAELTNIDVLVQLPQLEELFLDGCYLEKMPAGIGNLKNLRKLGLVGNSLSLAEQTRIERALPSCGVVF